MQQPLGGGQSGLLAAFHIELRPGGVEAAEIQLLGHLGADCMLHIGQVEHHAVGIEPAFHGHDQLVVVAMAWRLSAGAKTLLIFSGAQLRQGIEMARTKGGPARDHAGPALAVGGRGSMPNHLWRQNCHSL